MAILWNSAAAAADTYFKATHGAAEKLGITAQSFAVRGRDEFDAAFAAIARERFDAVVVIGDPIFYSARAQIGRLATQHRLPTVFTAREHVDAGGLLSYVSNIEDQWRRAAVFVDKILKGAKPADLPASRLRNSSLRSI